MSISWNWSDPALFNLLQTQNVVLSQILSTNHCQQQTTRNWVSVILPKNIPKNNILDAPNRDSTDTGYVIARNLNGCLIHLLRD